MPHVTLEYSGNIPQQINFKSLFRVIHEQLVTLVGVELGNIKSRAYLADHFYIGDGNEKNAFVALDINLFLEEREALIPALGHALLEQLRLAFATTRQNNNLQITVNIHGLNKAHYFK